MTPTRTPAAILAAYLAAMPAHAGAAPAPAAEPGAASEVSFAGCVQQPDGKILLAATVEGERAGRPMRWITVSRVDADGRADEAFARKGGAALRLDDGDAEASAIALLADGRIGIAGRAHRPAAATQTDAFVARLLPNGEPDRAFAGRGWRVEDLGGDRDLVAGIAADAKGGAFLAGSSLRPFLALMTRYDFSALRVTGDGSLDPAFGKGGKAFVRVGSVSEDRGLAVAAAPDGGVILAGLSRHSATPDFTVVRLTAAGGRDLRFGTLGWKIMRLSEKGSQANAVALQPDGKLVVGGEYIRERKSPGLKAIVVRLAPNGAFDEAFAEDGIAELKLPDADAASFQSVAVLGDGRILAAGVATGTDRQRKVLVARLLANGKPDLAFGAKGAVRIPLAARSADVRSLIAQADGRILVCGQSQAIEGAGAPSPGAGHFLLRLEPDGTMARRPGS